MKKATLTPATEKKLITSKIMVCTCNHIQQDEMYGVKHRVFNIQNGNDGKVKGWKCTVCNSTKGV